VKPLQQREGRRLGVFVTDSKGDPQVKDAIPLTAVPAHAVTHQFGGSDPLAIDTLDSASDNTNLNATITAHGLLPKLDGDATHFLDGQGNFSAPISGGHVHGLMRIEGDGATDTFNLLDFAEYLEHVAVAGVILDPLTFALSADRSQIVFDAAPGMGDVVTLEYVIAGV
jgi:hypothetical protein